VPGCQKLQTSALYPVWQGVNNDDDDRGI